MSRFPTTLRCLPLALGLAAAAASAITPPAPPLEANGYARYTRTAELSAWLAAVAASDPARARVERLGTSVLGRPIEALVLGGPAGGTARPLRVLVIGSQHGTESAGAEALPFVARDLLAGPLAPLLGDLEVVLVADPNPDGRALGLRANANKVNLNVDFHTASQPESLALLAATTRLAPDVALDVHESAILKRKSLALEGWLTDFETQVEAANHPAIDAGLRALAFDTVLPDWIARVEAGGVRCHRYIGEVRSTRQPITNGGLSLRNLRNRAAIEGVLSFLTETKLEPREGDYPTFRNVGARVERQRAVIGGLLAAVHAKRAEVLAAVRRARASAPPREVVLAPVYVPDPAHPRLTLPLRRLDDGSLHELAFADHRRVEARQTLASPAAYVVTGHQDALAPLLARHGIDFRVLDSPVTAGTLGFTLDASLTTEPAVRSRLLDETTAQPATTSPGPGDLWIDVAQPRGRLAVLLLEPASTSSIWRSESYGRLLRPGEPLPIRRVPAAR